MTDASPPKSTAVELDSLGTWSRTHTCGELTRADANLHVVLMGWVHRVRDHGGVLFVDVRDRYGVTQAVIPPDQAGPEVVERARELGSEWVIALRGRVLQRPPEAVNDALPTGAIEVHVEELKILNSSETPPFPVAARPRQRSLRVT